MIREPKIVILLTMLGSKIKIEIHTYYKKGSQDFKESGGKSENGISLLFL